jgi:hypothetical protein
VSKLVIVDSIKKAVKKTILGIGRFLEFFTMGETDYKLHTTEGEEFEEVSDLYKARTLVAQTKELMQDSFGIILTSPVIINLYSGSEFSLKDTKRELCGVLGQYHYENLGKNNLAHMIYIMKGLEKRRFRAVLAHEMTHAFLREAKLMNCDRYLREGFARWIEYKTLMGQGLKEDAKKILHIKTSKYGKDVEKIFRLEKKVGTQGVIEILRRID